MITFALLLNFAQNNGHKTGAILTQRLLKKWNVDSNEVVDEGTFLSFMDDMAGMFLHALVRRYETDPFTFHDLADEGRLYLDALNDLGVSKGYPDSTRSDLLPRATSATAPQR